MPRHRSIEEGIAKGTRLADGTSAVPTKRSRKKGYGEKPPQRVEGEVRRPAWMNDDPAALDCWERVTELLAKRGQLSRDSEVALESLCQTYSEWCRLRAFLKENGTTFKQLATAARAIKNLTADDLDDPRLYVTKTYPEVRQFQQTDRALRMWLIEFGLTDASRAKIGVTGSENSEGEESDVLAQYGLN